VSDSVKSRGLRRRRPSYDDSSSSWLVTYSDAITLLLAFFVMILSVSDLNQGKVEALQEGLASIMSDSTPATPFSDIKDGMDELIEKHDLDDQLEVTLDPKGVKIELSNVALYQSGSAELKTAAFDILKDIATVIIATSHDSHMVEVEGHTDDVPINTAQYPSNWELSAARATTVVKYLLEQGVSKERLKASGFADSRPKKESIALPLIEARQANRRVVIFIKRF